MNEEILQRKLIEKPSAIFGNYHYYNIGNTNFSSLIASGIISNNKVYKDVKTRKPDGIIIDSSKKVVAIVEHKKPSEVDTDKKREKIINEWFEITQITNAPILILTDTLNCNIWINGLNKEKIVDENKNPIEYPFDTNNVVNLGEYVASIVASITETNSQIKPPVLHSPTNLAKRVWQKIWMASGATPENCLYSFVELFIFKYLSDLNILQGDNNFSEFIKKYDRAGNTKASVLEDYSRNVRTKIKSIFKESTYDNTTIINGILFSKRDGGAIDGYDKVFEDCLKEFKKEGKLAKIDYDFKSKIFEEFLKESISKKNWGQYFTPIKVVRSIVDMARSDIKPNNSLNDEEKYTIGDPCCGVGKFLFEAVKDNLNNWFKFDENKKLQSKVNLIGYDKGFDYEEQKTIILAKANMLIYFSDLIAKHKSEDELTEINQLINKSLKLQTKSILGTLFLEEKEKYDLIITNPPYVTKGIKTIRDEIKERGLERHYTISSMGLEGLFMEWIIKALKKGGKAFIVIPDGILNRIGDKNLREYILKECFIDSIISLPPKTFFTINKKTYIIAITKKPDINDIQTEPVFTYVCSSIGETLNINRFETEENDLKQATKRFNEFKNNRDDFTTNDKRCKIQPFSKFKDNLNNWVIDKWWSNELLEELGIKEEQESINKLEFSEILNEIKSLTLEAGDNKDLIFEKKYFKVSDIFDIKKGNADYTKEYINENMGDYPVYSSQTKDDGIIGRIKHYDYDENCLTWTTDGTYVGTVFLRNGKFSMTSHCGALILKEEYKTLNLEYLQIILSEILPNYKEGEGSNKRLGKQKIADVDMPIPVKKNDEFDLQVQVKIVEEHKKIENLKSVIANKLEKITKSKVNLFE